jgi:Amidohydrolase
VFRRHVLTCFIADPVGIQLRHDIGIDNICWEQDYPHSDSSWPYAPEELQRVATKYDVPDADINKITYENAMRWYQFDAFAHRDRSECTVGALRAQVAGHDVSVRSMDAGRRERSSMNLGELARAATA